MGKTVTGKDHGASLGRLQGVALYVGSVLGSGILLIPAVAAELAGPASLLAWAAMAMITLPLALTMSMLAARFPGGGGVSTFVREAFGPTAGTVTGWLFLLTVPLGGPIAALIGAGYAVGAFGLPLSAQIPVAALILLICLGANYRGMKTAGWLQVGVVAAVTLVLLIAVGAAIPQIRAEQFTPFAPHGWLGVGKAAAILFWCFIGWEAVTHLSGEFNDPKRDLVPAVLWAAAVVSLLYVATAVAVVGTGAYGAEGKTDAALVLVVQGALGRTAGWVTGAIAIACVMATINAYIGAAAHLARSLAESGAGPQFLGRVHPEHGVPVGGLAFLVIGFTLVLTVLGLGWTDLRTLITLPTANFIAVYVLGTAAGLKLARNRLERWLAVVSLATSLAVYPFLGWSGVYPFVVSIVGLWNRWREVNRQVERPVERHIPERVVN